ncbi:MAG: TldD/PmbA family protein [Chloroflexota bacterium]|nr:TldD/PmbA family protein [Chloroflexota bacterium]
MTLWTEPELRRICEAALHATNGDQAEAVVSALTSGLTRFANNTIHQNVASREASLQVRVVVGKRVGMVRTHDLGADGIARAARSASEIALQAPENPVFAGLPPARPIAPAPSAFVERTAAATPLERATRVASLLRRARERRLSAAGYLSTTSQELAVASSEGVWAYAPSTMAAVETVVTGPAGTAWAERNAMDLGRIDVDAVAEEATAKCLAAQGPRDLAPGTYEVVLEPYAVSDIAQFIGSSLTGQSVEEGRSFVTGKLGRKVTGDVTIVDDPFDPELAPRAFDYEGQPSRTVTLVERGVARGLVYDFQTASRVGAEGTGHAVAPNPNAASSPVHLRIEPGTATRAELIRDVARGVLVTRFHYTRWVHQLRSIVTGMTRDGTFLVENGEIAHPVKNFRFTQSYHEALGTTLGVGNDLHLFAAGELTAGARRVPALRLGAFTFTGSTQH